MITLDEVAKQAFTVHALEEVWRRAHETSFPELYVRPWRGQDTTQMRHFLKDVPPRHAGRILVTAVGDWEEFTWFAARHGAFGEPPEFPNVGYATRNLSALVNFYAMINRPRGVPKGASFEVILSAIDDATPGGENALPTSPKPAGSNGSGAEAHEDA